MKTLYVVYDHWDAPFAECDTLKQAYHQARECAENYWYPVYIDKFSWDEKLKLKWYCEYNDLWFEDERGEWHWMDCVEDFGIIWYSLIRAETRHELNLFNDICEHCEINYTKDTIDKTIGNTIIKNNLKLEEISSGKLTH